MTWSPSNPDPGADKDPEWRAARSQQRAPTPHLPLRRDRGGGKAPGREKALASDGKRKWRARKKQSERHFPLAGNR